MTRRGVSPSLRGSEGTAAIHSLTKNGRSRVEARDDAERHVQWRGEAFRRHCEVPQGTAAIYSLTKNRRSRVEARDDAERHVQWRGEAFRRHCEVPQGTAAIYSLTKNRRSRVDARDGAERRFAVIARFRRNRGNLFFDNDRHWLASPCGSQ